VVVGTSSGGVEALRKLIAEFPEDLPAAVFVVVHFPERAPSALPTILNRTGSLKVVHPEDGDRIEKGRV
jgi:two-component system chemotaxis response regulator CheB